MAYQGSNTYDWLEEIPEELLDLEERPQFNVPPFPWKEMEERLQERFQKEFKITHAEKGWKKGNSFSAKEALAIYLFSIDTPLFLVMEEREIVHAIEGAFGSKEESIYFLEKPLLRGFFEYFILETLRELSSFSFGKYLDLKLGDLPDNYEKSLQEMFLFHVDISLKIGAQKATLQLLIPKSLQRELKKQAPPAFFLKKSENEKIAVPIAFEIGHVALPFQEFKRLKIGDCLLLDHCSFDIDAKEGWGILTLNGQNIFRGKWKKEGVTLLEFPRLEEGEREMREDDATEEEFQEVNKESEEVRDAPFDLEKLPLQIIVEVCRVKMTLEELSHLTPGTLLELPVAVEEGVHLVINGKRIGKGELVKMGDVAGVRITKL